MCVCVHRCTRCGQHERVRELYRQIQYCTKSQNVYEYILYNLINFNKLLTKKF